MSVNGTSVSDFNPAPEKRLSRVSRLRDMFQNGDIRPIEEIDNFEAYVSPPPFANVEDPSRFLRTLPGSPPLSALRNHRSVIAKEVGENSSASTKYRPESMISHANGLSTTTSSPGLTSPGCTVPPARPPKPRNLSFDKSSPSKYTPVKTKISSQLRKSIALFENGARGNIQNGVDNEKRSELNVSSKPTERLLPSLKQLVTKQEDSIESTLSVSDTAKPIPVAEQALTHHPQILQSSPDEKLGTEGTQQPNSHQDSLGPSQPILHTSANVEKSEHDCKHISDLDASSVQNPLSSWQATTALDRIESDAAESSALHDFILQSDAFRVSPQYLNPSNLEDSLPTWQQAEPIAVATPDEDEDEESDPDPREMYNVEDTDMMVSVIPVSESDIQSTPVAATLPVPPGLKVVAVDFQGVHILEDGNFFYSVPGLSSRPQSPEDSNFLSTRPRRPMSIGDQTEDHGSGSFSTSDFSGLSAADSVQVTDLSLPDTRTDSVGRQPRVRFSTEPIVIYSTHSTVEYNRRNEEIDPLAASAEYELEKHLEEMELISVDLKKGPQGLGISILGLGVDNVSGHQKLGIFIKALTPGGAAEADGRIQVFDQIVEVDGQSLVGVSQKFAAQTLRNTHDVVHFVLAREQDPANSRVAQLLAEQEEEERLHEAQMNASNDFNYDPTKLLSMSRDDSAETLHRLMADAAETAARAMAESVSDDEEGDACAVDEEDEVVIEDDSPFDQSPKIDTNQAMDFSTGSKMDSVPGAGAITSPRSALKGTATAASTKRRQEAISQLIQSAMNRSKSTGSSVSPSEENPLMTNLNVNSLNDTNSGPSSSSSCSASTPVPADGITWLLASDLYDCHTQLSKLQLQMRVLEQRLTAQEAAADEAIERLCLQCRHVEYELNEARQRLQTYLRVQNNSAGAEADRARDDEGQSETLHQSLSNGTVVASDLNSEYENTEVPVNGAVGDAATCPALSGLTAPTMGNPQASVNPVSANLSIWSSQNLGAELASLALQALDPTRASVIQEDGWITGSTDRTHDPPSSSPESYMKNILNLSQMEGRLEEPNNNQSGVQSLVSDGSSHLRGLQERVRLISSGGLSRRRPPTRVETEVTPALVLPPDVELNSLYSTYQSPSIRKGGEQDGNDNATSSSTALKTTNSIDPSQSLSELLVRSGDCEPHAATPTSPLVVHPPAPNRASPTGVVESDQLVVEAQPLLTLASPDDTTSPTSHAKHKRLGVELPGLSVANRVVLRHREPPERTSATITELSAAEVRRQANAELLASIKGLCHSP